MNKIQMVDLNGQYKKIKSAIDSSIQEVIESTAFINGKFVKEFSTDLENYLNAKHVIPCANGTDALQVAMMGLDLKPGDEIITTSFTFVATVEVIVLLGLKPVFVDVNPNTFLIEPELIEQAITSKTKAIIPVHLFGQCAQMEEIMNIAKANNLFVIEDTCQAIGSDCYFSDGTTKKAGTIGDIGCTSFFPSKNLGCYGDGGAIFTNNDELAKKLRGIVNHGMEKRYYHDYIGVNSRLDSIQAAVLKVKLPYLDEYSAARIKAANKYDDAFKNNDHIQIPERTNFSNHVFHQYTLKIKGIDRQKLIDYLAEDEIPAMVYYPVPLHLQKAYKDFVPSNLNLPITEQLMHEVMSLPMHTELTEEQQNRIINRVLNFIKNN